MATKFKVAPTIVQALGLKPALLDAVRAEGTPVLPEVGAQVAKKSLAGQEGRARLTP